MDKELVKKRIKEIEKDILNFRKLILSELGKLSNERAARLVNTSSATIRSMKLDNNKVSVDTIINMVKELIK